MLFFFWGGGGGGQPTTIFIPGAHNGLLFYTSSRPYDTDTN